MDITVFLESLTVMWKGMALIMIIMAFIAGSVSVLNKTLGERKKDTNKKDEQ